MTTRYLLKNEYKEWDKIVNDCLEGTLFSSTTWLNAINCEFKILGAFEKDKLIGGIAFFEKEGKIVNIRPTRFQGVIVKIGNNYEKVFAVLMKELSKKYDSIEIPSFVYISEEDLAGFKMTADNMKTFFVDLRDINKTFKLMEKRTRYEINKAEKAGIKVFESDKIKDFDDLHKQTFERQAKERKVTTDFIVSLFHNLKSEKKIKLYFTDNNGELSAGAIFVWDNKRAYYLMAASNPKLHGDGSPSLILWKAFCDFNKEKICEIDLAGANVPAIEKFKRGFGGKIFPYQIFKK